MILAVTMGASGTATSLVVNVCDQADVHILQRRKALTSQKHDGATGACL